MREHPGFTRRDCLLALAAGGLAAAGGVRAADTGARLVASWAEDGQHRAGVLTIADEGMRIGARIELPTRAHGLCALRDGSVLIAARRPGDWLLRWHPGSGAAQWHWLHEDRRLNGHALPTADGVGLWTTETDQADARGLVGVRDAASLEKTAEWPTHGMDPHALLVLPRALGALPAGTLIVANGGIPTQSETGRSHRDLTRMDPSLVALDPKDGTLLGQWRLDDARLSIRHLAFDPVGGCVGIALQAEHDDPAARAAAPVLARWDGVALQAAEPVPGLQGYGGDIAARPGGGFWVSAPRGHALVGWDRHGRASDRLPLREACAVTARGGHWWAGGRAQLRGEAAQWALPVAAELDNHWWALA